MAPWCVPGQAVAAQVAAGCSVAQALNAVPQAPQVFVPQAALPAGVAYEQFIYEGHGVPTRDGLHDFFNGLVWLHFPQTKRRLNALHMAQIARTGIAPQRGAARDALTLLDENGALLQAPDALWEALCCKEWDYLFGALRPLWAQARLLLFGHALMEKLVHPRKAITAHVYRVGAVHAHGAELDAWLAADLQADHLQHKPFAPLPVLGVPQWWPGNADPAFYADSGVFRASASATRMPSTPADKMPPA